MNLDRPQLLEVTLRDGSYAIDFGFSAADTVALCRALEGCGVRLIEVGHGIGLGASREGYGQAAASDDAYAQAARDGCDVADWGMFCIPGIARLGDLDILAEHGAGFVRVGANVDEYDTMRRFVARAKELGLFVACNFMKSYAVPPAAFGEACSAAEDYGADMVYLVDSAGGMLASDMREFLDALLAYCHLPWGFHGHDNLRLSVANALYALDAGAALVDTSLLGMGRSAGNVPTETFALAAARKGYELDVDALRLMDTAEQYIAPLVTGRPSGVDAVSGYAQFHSSYMSIIRRYAERYGVDPRRLIIAVCERDRIRCDEEMVEACARKLKLAGYAAPTARYRLDRYHGTEEMVRASTEEAA